MPENPASARFFSFASPPPSPEISLAEQLLQLLHSLNAELAAFRSPVPGDPADAVPRRRADSSGHAPDTLPGELSANPADAARAGNWYDQVAAAFRADFAAAPSTPIRQPGSSDPDYRPAGAPDTAAAALASTAGINLFNSATSSGTANTTGPGPLLEQLTREAARQSELLDYLHQDFRDLLRQLSDAPTASVSL